MSTGDLPRRAARTEDTELLCMLRAISELEELPGVADNAAVAESLGWSVELLNVRLSEARGRTLVWGVPVGRRRPAPGYVDLELTLQGRRLLQAADTVGAGTDDAPS